MLENITPVVLTFNEEANLGRTLDRLQWARDIVIVDSFSTDSSVAIASSYRQLRLFQRSFDSHAQQWNFAIGATNITTEWFLALDADYRLSDALVAEIAMLNPTPDIGGYAIGFRYCIGGVALRGTLYPPLVVLCRRSMVRYEQRGHTQRTVVTGTIGRLSARIFHDDRKPPALWFAAQQRYARLEAQYLLEGADEGLDFMDRIRRSGWAAPGLVFFYTLIAKGCIFEGWRGWFYVLQRTFAELLIAIEIVHHRLAPQSRND